jgi:RNA polymerase sigma-B factor
VPSPWSATAPPRFRRRDRHEPAREDRALFARYLDERDPVDRQDLVERFLPLARRLGLRYRRPGEPFDDLLQVASLGLVKAIDRFDVDRGLAFSSYAMPTILGELRRYLRDGTWSVHVPRNLQELALQVDRTVTALARDLRRQPKVAEVAEKLGVSQEAALEALEAHGAYTATSLETPRHNDDEAGATLGATIGTADAGFELAEHRATLAELMKTLSARDRQVVQLRFQHDLTQAEIGEHLGISQM